MTTGPVLQRIATQAASHIPSPGGIAAGAQHAAKPIDAAVNNVVQASNVHGTPLVAATTQTAKANQPGKIRQFASRLGSVGEAGLLGAGALGWAGLSAARDASAVSDVYERQTGRNGTVPGMESGLGSFIKRLLGIGVGGGLGYGLGQVAAGGLNLKGPLGALVRIPLAIGGAILGHAFLKHHAPTKGMVIREQMDYYSGGRYGSPYQSGYDHYGSAAHGSFGYDPPGASGGQSPDSYQGNYNDPYGQVTQRPIGIVDPYGGPRKGFIDSNHDGFNDISDPRYRDSRAPMALRDMAEIRGDYKGYWHYPQNKCGESQGLPSYTMPHPKFSANGSSHDHSHGNNNDYDEWQPNNGHSPHNELSQYPDHNTYGPDGWVNQDVLRLKPGGELLHMYRKSPRMLDNYFKDFGKHYNDSVINGNVGYADTLGVGPPRRNHYAGTTYRY